MKYIKLFEEYQSDDTLQLLLNNLGNKVDTNKLKFILLPYKDKLNRINAKYSVNGIIDSNLIYNDILSMNFSIDESVSSNMIVNILSRLIKLPIDLIKGIYYFFKDTFDSFNLHNGFRILIVSFIIFILGLYSYQVVEHEIDGIGIGIVNTEVEFIPEHDEIESHRYKDGNGHIKEYTTTEHIPDTWKTEVRGNNGRIEIWETTNVNIGKVVKEKDIVRIADWNWTATKSYGEETGGDFSGGGSGTSY